jgi:hypothetical protein
VDFPAPAPQRFDSTDSAERPWKKAAIVTAAVAAVELVVLVVVALAFVAKPFASDAAGPAAKATAEQSAVAPRPDTPVLVLNGNGVSGAATKAAKIVRRLDYPVVQIGDASRKNFSHTLVMYREGSRPAAVRLAQDLDLSPKRAVPLDGMRDSELVGAELALVIGG